MRWVEIIGPSWEGEISRLGLQVKVNIGQGMMGSVFYFVRWLYYDDFFPSLVFIVAWFCISVWFFIVFFALWCGFGLFFCLLVWFSLVFLALWCGFALLFCLVLWFCILIPDKEAWLLRCSSTNFPRKDGVFLSSKLCICRNWTLKCSSNLKLHLFIKWIWNSWSV